MDAALPALIAAVLYFPCLSLAYVWDDYYFLRFPPSLQLTARPIPQGLYFWLLSALGPWGPLVGHIFNLALVAVSIVLLVRLASRLSGRRTGRLAGLFFAASAPLGALVAWVSGVQDLLAIVFVLLALNLRHSGRNLAAVGATALGLLCKETVLAFLPALIFWDAILGRRPSRVGLRALVYGGLAAAWAPIHPGVRELFEYDFRGGVTGYAGLARPDLWAFHAMRYGMTMLNLPITGIATPWPTELTAVGGVALAFLLGGLALFRSDEWPHVPLGGASLSRVAALAVLLMAPAVLLHAVLLRHWASYFAGLPAIGCALLLGTVAARAPARLAAAGLAVYLVLGVWSRGVVVPGGLVLTERNYFDASAAIRRVEANFRKLHPTLPDGAQVLLSMAPTGMLGIHQAMHEGQALRLWYGDSGLVTLPPEQRRAGFGAEFLFRITPDLDVVEIDPDRLASRSSGRAAAPHEIAMPISSYARGLAASGDPERAVRILERLATSADGPNRSYFMRLEAMALLTVGKIEEAERIRAAAPALSREEALDFLVKIYAEPTASPGMDSMAFPMFSVSPSDPEALRYLMEMFHIMGYKAQTVDFARRLQSVVPGDSTSAERIRSPAPRR